MPSMCGQAQIHGGHSASEMSQAAAIMMPARRGVLRARYVSGLVTEKYLLSSRPLKTKQSKTKKEIIK